MRINAINYNNFYNKNMGNNSNNVAFNGLIGWEKNLYKLIESDLPKAKAGIDAARKPVFYMEHLTDEEIELLSGYANSLKQKIIPEKLMLGPTFDIVEKVVQVKPKFSSFPEFIQLALRAENDVTNKMILKAKHYSSLCAEKYPKENYAKEVDEILNQIEKSEPAALEKLSSNPLWNYTNILQKQSDWVSVKQEIIRECDVREKRINRRIDSLDDKFTSMYYELENKVHCVKNSILEEIDRMKGYETYDKSFWDIPRALGRGETGMGGTSWGDEITHIPHPGIG